MGLLSKIGHAVGGAFKGVAKATPLGGLVTGAANGGFKGALNGALSTVSPLAGAVLKGGGGGAPSLPAAGLLGASPFHTAIAGAIASMKPPTAPMPASTPASTPAAVPPSPTTTAMPGASPAPIQPHIQPPKKRAPVNPFLSLNQGKSLGGIVRNNLPAQGGGDAPQQLAQRSGKWPD